MAKSTATKKAPAKRQVNTAYAKKENGKQRPAEDNDSKYQPGDEVLLNTLLLSARDGVSKLLLDCIKDIYWAENHLLIALPKMARAASLPALRDAILDHLEETRTHVQRLEQVFEMLGKKPQACKCEAMEGLSKEGEAVIETTDMESPARDLGIILSSQKVEHYEMAAYMGIIKLANMLGHTEIASLLAETLEEEQNSDAKLDAIADNDLSSFDEDDEDA